MGHSYWPLPWTAWANAHSIGFNVDGTGKETLTGLAFVPMGYDWSADGTKIVYVGATKFSRELYVW